MQFIQRTPKIVLVLALLFAVAAVFLPNAGANTEVALVYEWVATPEAQARTLAGDCAAAQQCLELCAVANNHNPPRDPSPQGIFQCFDL